MYLLNDNTLAFEEVSYLSAQVDQEKAAVPNEKVFIRKVTETFENLLSEETHISEEKQRKLLGAYKNVVNVVVEVKDKEIEVLRNENSTLMARVKELEQIVNCK